VATYVCAVACCRGAAKLTTTQVLQEPYALLVCVWCQSRCIDAERLANSANQAAGVVFWTLHDDGLQGLSGDACVPLDGILLASCTLTSIPADVSTDQQVDVLLPPRTNRTWDLSLRRCSETASSSW
jgi:hypothetical protein